MGKLPLGRVYYITRAQDDRQSCPPHIEMDPCSCKTFLAGERAPYCAVEQIEYLRQCNLHPAFWPLLRYTFSVSECQSLAPRPAASSSEARLEDTPPRLSQYRPKITWLSNRVELLHAWDAASQASITCQLLNSSWEVLCTRICLWCSHCASFAEDGSIGLF